MTVTANLNAPTEIIFDLQIEGLATLTTLECRFCIHGDMSFFFPCTKVGEKQFSVKLPALSMLTKGKNCNFTIEVIADNYFFKALEDTLTVTETTTNITATVAQPSQPVQTPQLTQPKEEPKPTAPQPESTKPEPKVEPKPEPQPEIAAVEPIVNTPPPKAADIPMVFKPGKTSFEMEPVSTPLLKSVMSDGNPQESKPVVGNQKNEQPSDEKKPAEKKKGFVPFTKKNPDEKKDDKKDDKKKDVKESKRTDKDLAVLEILAENEKQQHERVKAEVSQEILEMIDKREKNKRVAQILKEHTQNKGK